MNAKPFNPYLGLSSFSAADSSVFRGRDAETAELLSSVQHERLTVLFGRSGLGKTSLIQAGLFPRLDAERFLPVPLRLDLYDERSPRQQVIDAVVVAAGTHDLAIDYDAPTDDLWRYFDGIPVWDVHHQPRIPALVFDQFEEFLRAPDPKGLRSAFLEELGALIENRVPRDVREQWAESDAPRRTRPAVRVLLSLREDYLALLEELRTLIPSVVQNRLRLRRLTGAGALQAVLDPAKDTGAIDAETAEKIVRAAAVQDDASRGDPVETLRVEPFLLSLLSYELFEEHVQEAGDVVPASAVAPASEHVIRRFYDGVMKDLADAHGQETADATRTFIEDELVTPDGHRTPAATASFQDAVPNESEGVVAFLTHRRVLREEPHFDRPHLELIHDRLAHDVAADRDLRHEREEVARREQAAERRATMERQRAEVEQRRARHRMYAAIAGLVLAVGGIIAAFTFLAQRKEIDGQREDLAKNASALKITNEELLSKEEKLRKKNKTLAEREASLRENLRASDALSLSFFAAQQRERDPMLGLMLAVKAAEVNPDSQEVTTSLQSLISAQSELNAVFPRESPYELLAVNPSGSEQVLLADKAGTLWDWQPQIADPQVVARLKTSVKALYFSDDGSAFGARTEGAVHFGRFDGQDLTKITPAGELEQVSLAPDGKSVAIATAAAGRKVRVTLYALPSGDVVHAQDVAQDGFGRVAGAKNRSALVFLRGKAEGDKTPWMVRELAEGKFARVAAFTQQGFVNDPRAWPRSIVQRSLIWWANTADPNAIELRFHAMDGRTPPGALRCTGTEIVASRVSPSKDYGMGEPDLIVATDADVRRIGLEGSEPVPVDRMWLSNLRTDLGDDAQVALSADGTVRAGASPEATAPRILTEFTTSTWLRGHLTPIRQVAFASVGTTLYSISERGTLRRWQADPHAKLLKGGIVHQFFEVAPSRDVILLQEYDPAMSAPAVSACGGGSCGGGASCGGGGTSCGCGGGVDGGPPPPLAAPVVPKYEFVDLQTGARRALVDVRANLQAGAYASERPYAVLVDRSGRVGIWDFDGAHKLWVLEKGADQVLDIAMSPQGDHVAILLRESLLTFDIDLTQRTVSASPVVTLPKLASISWEINTPNKPTRRLMDELRYGSIEYVAGGKFLVSWITRQLPRRIGNVQSYEQAPDWTEIRDRTGAVVQSLSRGKADSRHVRRNPRRPDVGLVDQDGPRMFRVGNGVKEVAVVAVPSVFDFLFTPDGTRMLTLDARTGTLVLWDTDGQEVARLAAPHAATSVLADQPAGGDAGGDPCGVGEDPVETPSAHFMASFDGSTLSVTASKGFITAYRSTGKALFSLDLEANDSCGAAGGHVLNADGSRIVASYGPGVRVIETDISKLVEQAKKLVTRPFTKAELAEYSELWTKHLEPEDK